MKVPLQIVFRNMGHSDSIEAWVRQRVVWLERFCSRVISCRVAIEAPHKHHRAGNIFHVRVDLRVPGEEIVISRRPDLHVSHRDMYVALHDAFDEARRRLEEYTRRRRMEVKHSVSSPHGVIIRLVRDDGGYGFLRTEDGRDLYFHSSSVLGHRYDSLEEGMRVRYVEEKGDEGPQASTVETIGRRSRKETRKRVGQLSKEA